MTTTLIVGLVAGAIALGSGYASAQMHQNHDKHPQSAPPDHSAHTGKPKGDTGPSSAAYQAINAKMHEGMDIAFTGNADIDFARGMIPHHLGAVEMAKTVLAFGKDPQLRKLAEEIIKAQETEIVFMQEWLKANAK